jgi:hypothetical protein
MVDLIDKSFGFQRAQKQIIPDIFKGDLHPGFFGERDEFPDGGLRPIIGLFIGDLFVY